MARLGRSYPTRQPKMASLLAVLPPPPPPVAAADWVQVAAATAVPINPGDNAQTVVNGQPAGTTFCIKTGTHVGFTLTLTTAHNGVRFIAEPGTVLDGNGVTAVCIRGFTRDVVFRGWSATSMMTIRNYVPPGAQSTVVSCVPNDDVRVALPGWELAYLALTDNGGVSVRGGASSNIHDCTITNAGADPLNGAGYGSPLNPCIVRNIVITNFNTSGVAPGFEGGVKFAWCRYVDVSNVTIVGNPNHAAMHDSWGLWFDIDCEHIVIRDCNISHVPRSGIVAEISGTIQIYNNTITNCGYAYDGVGIGSPSASWAYGNGAGILIASSGHGPLGDGLDVSDNVIDHCNEGIIVLEQARGVFYQDRLTHHFGQDIRVMRNKINASGGSGVLCDVGVWNSATTYGAGTQPDRDGAGHVRYGGRMFMSKQGSNLNHTPPSSATSDAWWEYFADEPWSPSRRIRWNLNTYTGSCGPTASPHEYAAFYWFNGTTDLQTFSTWQALGQDINGTYS